MVIPGPSEGRSPEHMYTGLWKLGSGLAAARRPGMTGLGTFSRNWTARLNVSISDGNSYYQLECHGNVPVVYEIGDHRN
jgi:hypothetical protein